MKKKIAVIFGGRSAEHDVSIITAYTPIINSLIAAGSYDIYPIYIAKDNSWYSTPEMSKIDFFKGDYEKRLGKKLKLSFDNGLNIIWPGIVEKKIKIDVVFPAMHGTYGEDGSLMGILRMADVAFVGCDMSSSAVAMDKVFTKQVLSVEGIPVVPYVWFSKGDKVKDTSSLKMPLFVKPVHLGSSIGISKVKDQRELADAIEVAFHYDDKVLVEESVDNLIEVTLPIMGNDNPQPALIERAVNKSEFFDFSDKYLSDGKKGAKTELPAKIGVELSKRVIDLGLESYKVLGCSGTARVDFLIDGRTEQVYVNEINTLPGSLYHHNWRAFGISPIELVNKLIKLAEERFDSTKEITYLFETDILKMTGKGKGGK